jgi:hypothetical protein
MLGAMVIWIGSAAMLPNDKKETNIQASEVMKVFFLRGKDISQNDFALASVTATMIPQRLLE